MNHKITIFAGILIFTQILIAGPIEDLAPGQWYEVPNSRLEAVDPEDDPLANPNYPGTAPWHANIGVRSVMALWSSGAYDTKRDRLIVWGGGHAGYAGNEIYTFDVNTLAWERVTNPSIQVQRDVMYYPDGKPTSRHTYDYIQYVPAIDRFCTFGGAGIYGDGQHGGSNTDCFDFETKTWSRKADATSYGIGAISDVDPVTGHVFVRGNNNYRGSLSEWDPVNNTWTVRVASESDRTMYTKTGAIDPTRRIMVGIGGGSIYAWDISGTGSITRQTVTTSGPQDMVTAGNPGNVYDPVSDKFVCWDGGQSVYTLDWDTRTWTRVNGAGANPGPTDNYGPYGRWRYVPSKNVFITVDATAENVFFFKLTSSSGTAVKKLPAPRNNPALSIAPNPFRSDTRISLASGGLENRPAELHFFRSDGKLIDRAVVSARQLRDGFSWNRSAFPAGVYMVRLTCGSTVMMDKLIIF